MKIVKNRIMDNRNPTINDSIKPDFEVVWLNKSTRETGNSTFFTYENGVEIINAVFVAIYPEREILYVRALSR